MKKTLLITLTLLLVSIVTSQPIISSFSPKYGKPGETITLTGSGFNSTSSDNIVRIGGIKCDVSSASTTSLTVVLPGQITTDYFYVTDIVNSLIGKSFQKFPYLIF